MNLDLGRVISHTFSICWRHKWLWVLGVFGGSAGGGIGIRGGFNYNPFIGSRRGAATTPEALQAQVQAFLNEWLWLLLLIAVALVLIVLAAFLLACVAVPGTIWSALALDAGQPASLGTAWSQGVARFWLYFRLYLLRSLIGLALLVVVGVLVTVGVLIFASAGVGSLVELVPVGILLLLAYLVVSLVLAFLFTWSERTAFILDVGAVDALRTSARLARRAWIDTLVLAIVMGLIVGLTGFGITIVAVLAAAPGIVILFMGGTSGALQLAIAGVLWIVILGGGLYVVGAGFLGSVIQVSYALACRDLCRHFGFQLAAQVPLPMPAAPMAVPAPPPAPA